MDSTSILQFSFIVGPDTTLVLWSQSAWSWWYSPVFANDILQFTIHFLLD